LDLEINNQCISINHYLTLLVSFCEAYMVYRYIIRLQSLLYWEPSSPSLISQLFGFDHPYLIPSLVSIFYIPYAHTNNPNIILNRIQLSIFWSSSFKLFTIKYNRVIYSTNYLYKTYFTDRIYVIMMSLALFILCYF
jgi:hypothetical protein